MSDIDPNALASALPAGITYDRVGADYWNAQEIAEFQAERLAESGYQLVYVDEATVERVARRYEVQHQLRGDAEVLGCSCGDDLGDVWLHDARAVLAALADPETGGAA